MKNLVLLFGMLLGSSFVFAQQTQIDRYDYLVVPKIFDYQKSVDEFQVNSLIVFLFNKMGYDAYLESDVLPSDLKFDSCKAFEAFVIDDSGLFLTRVAVELRNCRGDVIYTTEQGSSKTKDMKKAYHEAVREAMSDPKLMDYVSKGEMVPVVQDELIPIKDSEPAPIATDMEVIAETAVESNQEVVELPTSNCKKSFDFDMKPYLASGIKYSLSSTDAGFELYDSQTGEIKAILTCMNEGDSFKYSGDDGEGTAMLTPEMILVIEYTTDFGEKKSVFMLPQ